MTFSLKVAFSFLQLKISGSYKSINLCWVSTFFFSISSCTYCWCFLYFVYLYLMLVESFAKLFAALEMSVSTTGLTTFEGITFHSKTFSFVTFSPFWTQSTFALWQNWLGWNVEGFVFLFIWTSMMCHCWIGKWLAGRTKSSSNMISWKGR